MSDNYIEISIPCDNDGFMLLQCSHCGNFFKLMASDCHADDVIEIWCPTCGLKSDNYLTEDVMELAFKIIENKAMDIVFEELKELERHFKGSYITLSTGKKPLPNFENQIRIGIEALETQNYECCKRQAKIKHIVKFSGNYCPFCGVFNDGD